MSGLWEEQPMAPEIRGTGYVVRSLEAALWALDGKEGSRARALLTGKLGDEAIATGAVCDQLAGARYGVGFIRQAGGGIA